MKKSICILFLLFFSAIGLYSQSRVFCELLGVQKFLSTKVTVTVDFGQARNFFSDNRLTDENGNVIVFNSMVDAMNYMGALGWQFEQAYVVTLGNGSTGQNVYHWLLSKEGTSEDITLLTKSIYKESERLGENGEVKAAGKKVLSSEEESSISDDQAAKFNEILDLYSSAQADIKSNNVGEAANKFKTASAIYNSLSETTERVKKVMESWENYLRSRQLL